MIKAIVFDFDGLIVDTESPWYDALCEVYSEHGAELPLELYIQCVGTDWEHFDPYVYLSECTGKSFERTELQSYVKQKHMRLMEQTALRPGVKEYLEEAKALGLKIGLASSSEMKWVKSFLERFELLSYFECIRTSDYVKKVKPDPELYLQAVECLGVQPHEAIAFEDSLNGLRAAKAAGLNCFVVPNRITNHLPFEMHDGKLSSMAERKLQDVIQQFIN